MDYFGWQLSNNMLLEDVGHLKALNFNLKDGFEPNKDNWTKLFSKLKWIIEKSGLRDVTSKDFGYCLHFAPGIPRLLRGISMTEPFKESVRENFTNGDFQLGMHSTHGDNEIILKKQFSQVLENDLKYAQEFNVKALVEHAALGSNNQTTKMVELLTKPKITNLMEEHDVIICWENKQAFRKTWRYYSSLKEMVIFLNKLRQQLSELGKTNLIQRHKFCLDVGHLLTWYHQSKDKEMVEAEIKKYLPLFGKETKVFHIHANDGTKDSHITPFSLEFFDHKSRKEIDEAVFIKYSKLVLRWLKICYNTDSTKERHFILEAGTKPYSIDQYLDFAKEFKSYIYSDLTD
ncbi:MAG: hypothetical protein GF364_02500 [Candidatus Lokiarchaeota archaeon]|nr:hypothetical protein [Candidatus Lokiarchaeota archaeon]